MKNLQNLGTVLNKTEQISINGGGWNCNQCYANNGGAYNSDDPSCDGCPPPFIK